MGHPRALTEQEAIDAEAWYQEYERVGTIAAKAKELGVTRETLYDTIKRVRGQLTKNTRAKLSALDLDALTNELLAGSTFHVERRQIVEEQLDTQGNECGK